MVADAHLPSNHRAVAHRARARDARPRHENHVLADVAVVAHVHQVVELRSAADPRLLQRAAVDGRVGADLHVVLNHQRPLLRKLRVRAGLRVAHIAKSVRAQHRARMNHHAIAQCVPG